MSKEQHPKATPAAGERFDSWKEIATYLKKSVRTVQRWEKEERLPVHRHRHRSLGSVYAFREELDRWFRERRLLSSKTAPAAPVRKPEGLAIGVLPLRSWGGEAGEDPLARRLEDELVGALAALPGVRVASPATVAAQGTKPISELARDLNLQLALEGSVRVAAEGVRAQIRIMDVGSGLTLTTKTVQGDLADFGGRSELMAQQIATQVVEEWRRAARTPSQTSLPEVERAYRASQGLLAERSRSSLEQAREILLGASRNRPASGLAQAGLAECFCLMGLHGYHDPREAFPLAEAAVAAALKQEPELAETHAARGLVELFFHWDWKAAEAAFLEALTLRPGYPAVRCWLSMNLAVMGRPFEAVEQVRLATEMDSASPVVQSYVAGGYYYAGQFEASVSKALEIQSRHPQFPSSRLFLGRALTQLRRWDEAERHLRQAVAATQHGPDAVSALAHMLALSGRVQEAERTLQELPALGYYLGSGHRATLEIGRGQPEQALGLLERAREERFPLLVLLKIDPLWNSLRSLAAFGELLKHMGLSN